MMGFSLFIANKSGLEDFKWHLWIKRLYVLSYDESTLFNHFNSPANRLNITGEKYTNNSFIFLPYMALLIFFLAYKTDSDCVSIVNTTTFMLVWCPKHSTPSHHTSRLFALVTHNEMATYNDDIHLPSVSHTPTYRQVPFSPNKEPPCFAYELELNSSNILIAMKAWIFARVQRDM